MANNINEGNNDKGVMAWSQWNREPMVTKIINDNWWNDDEMILCGIDISMMMMMMMMSHWWWLMMIDDDDDESDDWWWQAMKAMIMTNDGDNETVMAMTMKY